MQQLVKDKEGLEHILDVKQVVVNSVSAVERYGWELDTKVGVVEEATLAVHAIHGAMRRVEREGATILPELARKEVGELSGKVRKVAEHCYEDLVLAFEEGRKDYFRTRTPEDFVRVHRVLEELSGQYNRMEYALGRVGVKDEGRECAKVESFLAFSSAYGRLIKRGIDIYQGVTTKRKRKRREVKEASGKIKELAREVDLLRKKHKGFFGRKKLPKVGNPLWDVYGVLRKEGSVLDRLLGRTKPYVLGVVLGIGVSYVGAFHGEKIKEKVEEGYISGKKTYTMMRYVGGSFFSSD